MFGSDVLEVALGLVFVYLLTSLVCSGIHDWIAGVMNTKAKALEKRLVELLGDSELVSKIYDHPLVKSGTYKSLYDNLLGRSGKELKPAFIDNEIFASVVTEVIKENIGTLDALFKDDGSGKKKHVLKSLVDSVAAEVGTVEDNLKLLREKIENWFDGSMKKMSAWYKQKARFIIFFIALILTAALNIDSIMITKVLYQDEAARQAVVKVAGEMKELPEIDSKTNPIEQAVELETKLSELRLPIGWNWDKTQNVDLRGRPVDWGWLYKILGILLSTLAASMGAPFWFNILRKMMKLKSLKKE